MSRPTGGQMPRTRRTQVPADPRQGPAKRAPQDREASAPHQWPLEQLAHSRLPCPNPTANCRRFSFNIFLGCLITNCRPNRCTSAVTTRRRSRPGHPRTDQQYGSPPSTEGALSGTGLLAAHLRSRGEHVITRPPAPVTAASTAARRAWERARSRADGQPTCPDLAGKSGGQGSRGSYNDSRSPISAYSASRQDGRPATTKLSPSRSSIHV